MKIALGIILIILALVGAGIYIWNGVWAGYQWDNGVMSYWNLSDKASTIAAKSENIDKFIAALQSASLADNNALFYKTQDNNCANNVAAVTTLRDRLDQIKGMDESSFQYQQAIQQITAQEQGEASDTIGTLYGCWLKANHYVLWNPLIFLAFWGLVIFVGLVGGAIIAL